MARDWLTLPLGDVIELKRGYDLPQSRRRHGPVPIVSSAGISGSHSEAMVKGPGVVTGRYGTIGEVFFLADDFWPLNTTLYVRDFKGSDPKFISYFLKSLDFFAYSDKAAVPGLNRNHLHQAMVRIPSDVNEQRAIAGILGALDEKIELNGRSNKTLIEVANILFRGWDECRSNPAPRLCVSQLVADSILEIGDGYRAKNDEMGKPGLPFVRAGELNSGFNTDDAEILSQASVQSAGSKTSRLGDVAFTSKGTIGRFARVTEYTPPFVYSPQICFWRTIDHARLRPEILYLWMIGPDFRAQVDAVAGQTDMAPYVSLRDQKAMTVPLFGPEHHDIADQVSPLLAREAVGVAESRTLAKLRNMLLPKLVSGNLRVRDAERFISDTLA